MTIDISDNNPRIEYTVAQGVVQTVFTVPFEFFEDSDVSIYVDGTLKVLGTDYNLTGGDGSTGTATFVTATPPAVQQVTGATGGSTVSIVRHVTLERTTDFAAGQEINRASLNEQLDTITAQIADLDNKVDRTIHLSDFEVAPSMLLTDDRKGRVLAFDTTTGDVEAGPLSNDIQTIADNISEILAADDEAAAAAASATAAASSASAASSSATAAAASETAAETAETNAETAQTAAETAESNAATSETNAATSETNAATSATNAATSATEAETAKTSAEAARDSALAALDSFDDRYLGVKTSEPTVDNDGDALLVGALYFNSTTDKLYIYDGSAWQVTTSGAAAGDLVSTNNLSDLTSAATARTNLGLGTAATTASTDYATAAQGTTADAALPRTGGAMTGAITTNSTFDGRDVATDGTKLDGIEDNADVTDTANVTAAGALMDSELTDIAAVKALDQGVATTDSPTFANVDVGGNIEIGSGADAHSNANDFAISKANNNVGLSILSNDASGISRIYFGSQTSTQAAKIQHNENNSRLFIQAEGSLFFQTGGTNNRMTVDSSTGNVGIGLGTAAASTALEVSGTATATTFDGGGIPTVVRSTALTSADSMTYSHGQGSAPDLVWAELHITTAVLGYSVGDVIKVYQMFEEDENDHGITVYGNATNLGLSQTGSDEVYKVAHRTNGTIDTITSANSDVKLVGVWF